MRNHILSAGGPVEFFVAAEDIVKRRQQACRVASEVDPWLYR